LERLFNLDPQLIHDAVLLALAVFVMFTFLSYLLFNPARDFLKKRQDKIKNDLDTAAADKADARKLKEDYNAKIQNINAEAEEILAQARQKALDNEAKIIAEAKEEAARILSRANAQVELERKAAADDMKKEMIALASLMAEKAVAGAVDAKVQDATIYDPESEQAADIVIADVPCSGYGVIGKKPEIKYRATPQKQEEIVMLQRMILDKAAKYVKPDGTLIFSTCTIAREENEENVLWFLKNYPFRLESLDPYIPEELHCKSTKLGYLQLLPGIHKTDGFFIARFRRK